MIPTNIITEIEQRDFTGLEIVLQKSCAAALRGEDRSNVIKLVV